MFYFKDTILKSDHGKEGCTFLQEKYLGLVCDSARLRDSNLS